jgi:hypothetical protein
MRMGGRPATSRHTGAGEPVEVYGAGVLVAAGLLRESSAPRGAVDSDGGGRPSSPCRRSGGVKLEAAVPGDRRGWWEQPRQSWVGPGLPDGPGPVSETGRYTRGTGVVTPLQATPALIRWMWAGSRCRPAPHFGRETSGSVCSLGPGGHGEGLRRSRGDAAGVEPGASPVDRVTVNVGTTSLAFHRPAPAGGGRWIGPMPADGGGGTEPS